MNILNRLGRLVISAFAVGFLAHASAAPVRPSGFVARLYTEGLGRIADKDPSGSFALDPLQGFRYWALHHNNGASATCNSAFLHDLSINVLTSPEFIALWNAPKQGNTLQDVKFAVTAAYRAVLSREPEQPPNSDALGSWAGWIFSGGAADQIGRFAAFIGALTGTSEFALLADKFCAADGDIDKVDAFIRIWWDRRRLIR